MDWALNIRGERIHAAASSGGWGLLCPVCGEPVRLKRGLIYKSHFAHLSGSKRPDCELYTPGQGGGSGSSASLRWCDSGSERWAEPALVWDAQRPVLAALTLRLPSDAAASLEVTSRRGTHYVEPNSGTSPSFVPVSLSKPPAEVKTRPFSPVLDEAVAHCLARFELSWNYFLARGEGGVLIDKDAHLEEGADYWLVSQSALPHPNPPGVEVLEAKRDRDWHAFLLRLGRGGLSSDDKLARENYLRRSVLPARPRLALLWPRPLRVYVDGSQVLQSQSECLLVRSSDGVPKVRIQNSNATCGANWIQGDIFEIKLGNDRASLEIETPRSRRLQILFERSCPRPPSAWLVSASGRARLEDEVAASLVLSSLPVELETPYRGLASKTESIGDGVLRSSTGGPANIAHVACGGFGAATAQSTRTVALASRNTHWSHQLPRWLLASLTGVARSQLFEVKSAHQMHRWAAAHHAEAYLPSLLAQFKRGPSIAVP